jgi:type IV pilus assembly protein PilX
MTHAWPFNGPHRQEGTVLVISLVILLAMTLIGITSLQTTVLEEKMTGNLKDQNAAFQSVEAGMREAMDWIESRLASVAGMPLANSSGSTKVWAECAAQQEEGKCNNGTTAVTITWLSGNGLAYGHFTGNSDGDLGDVVSLPRSIVEERYAPPPEFDEAVLKKGVVHYTQTSIGVGATTQARAAAQTTVPVPRL